MVSAASSMAAIALVLVCAACGSVGSPQDQYKAREKSGREDQLHSAAAAKVLAQATDQTSQTHHFPLSQSQHSNKLYGDKTQDSYYYVVVPEHQVVATSDSKIEFITKRKRSNARRERHKRAAAPENRSKRNTPWSGNVPDVPAFSNYQPQTMQISRPYYVPVWYQGPNRIPLYLPPQPILANPGYPPHNKPGPQNAYLPPPPSPPSGTPDSNLPPQLGNRDDEIYWGVVEAPAQTQRPTGNNRPRPVTRPPSSVDRVPGDGRIPDDLNDNFLSNNPNQATTQRPSNRPTRPNTNVDRIPGDGSIPSHLLVNDIGNRPNGGTRPRPNNGNNARPTQRPQRPIQNQNNAGAQTQRPVAQRPPWNPTTESPRSDSSCVWAILSCCVPGNMEVKESCFENRGCSGPFWGNSPCSPTYTNDVINSAMNYFE